MLSPSVFASPEGFLAFVAGAVAVLVIAALIGLMVHLADLPARRPSRSDWAHAPVSVQIGCDSSGLWLAVHNDSERSLSDVHIRVRESAAAGSPAGRSGPVFGSGWATRRVHLLPAGGMIKFSGQDATHRHSWVGRWIEVSVSCRDGVVILQPAWQRFDLARIAVAEPGRPGLGEVSPELEARLAYRDLVKRIAAATAMQTTSGQQDSRADKP